jgi:hypothetical protein
MELFFGTFILPYCDDATKVASDVPMTIPVSLHMKPLHQYPSFLPPAEAKSCPNFSVVPVKLKEHALFYRLASVPFSIIIFFLRHPHLSYLLSSATVS